jgi:ribose transport system permease protein
MATAKRDNGGHSARTRRRVPSFTMALEVAVLPIITLILILVFSLDGTVGSVFTSKANVDNILGNQSVTALVALAMIVPLVSGYFDLSVSAILGVTNIGVAATLGTHHWPLILALAFGLGLGAFIGFINGFLVAKLRLNGFIVTLGTYTLMTGLITWYTKGEEITQGIPLSFGSWGSGNYLGLPRPFLLLIVIAVITWYVLTQIPFGRYLAGIGSNESAARLVGIDTTRVVWGSFVVSGLLAGIAGALQTSRAGGADPTIATAYLFPALAAVFLGATTISPGRYNVWGTIIGVYFVAVSVSGFTLLGADVWVQPVFNGGSLVAAVALSTFMARQRERRTAVRHSGPLSSDDGEAEAASGRDLGTGALVSATGGGSEKAGRPAQP